MTRLLCLVLLSALCLAQNGPGNGDWEVVRPEDEGLSQEALERAEVATNGRLSGRVCYLVVKNGKIVYERYRGSGSVNRRNTGWSITKSLCGGLFGVAVEQGWANVKDRVTDRNSGTRSCNREAQFEHVLSMTGQSSNLNNPTYNYDTFGTACLDSVSDFIGQNNPQGLSANAWKNRFYQDVLGMQDTSWGGLGLGCGFGADLSCRDMARAAQLIVNDGAWAGVGQLADRQFSQDFRKAPFPSSPNYGYTLPLWRNDPVDAEVGAFVGLSAQCAIISKEHETVIISMGSGGNCRNAWDESKSAIISADKRHLYDASLFNSTKTWPQADEDQDLEAVMNYNKQTE